MNGFLISQMGFDPFAPIADILGRIFNLLYEFLNILGIHNTAISIILFTFLIYALMIPLTLKQQKFSKLQSKMAPELSKVTAKYKGKKDETSMRKQQLETQAVYSKYGASPTGGCLTALISLPIMFALYRVIQHIPTYVTDIYNLYQPVAEGIQNTPNFTQVLGGEHYKTITNTLAVGIDKWSTLPADQVQSNIITLLGGFKGANWTQLIQDFPALQSIISTSSSSIMNINSFVGNLNILELPGWAFPGILIPILATALQYVQTKMMSLNTTMDPNNPAASSLKTMNLVMPLMSGGFCIFLPIGVGLYWIAGSLFRIVQQFFVNRHLDKIDINDLIEKNLEKANRKKAKLGINPDASVKEISNTRTSSIQDTISKANASKNTQKDSSNYQKSDVSYKSGSISANANLLKRSNVDKGDK